MDDTEARMVVGCLAALAVCILLHNIELHRLRRKVDFAIVVAEKRMTDV